jgi:hypothetical protein
MITTQSNQTCRFYQLVTNVVIIVTSFHDLYNHGHVEHMTIMTRHMNINMTRSST